jgi:hypothetical protein
MATYFVGIQATVKNSSQYKRGLSGLYQEEGAECKGV